ncbi:hypothetical protein ACHAP3_004369 [Botrytis cinerea]
MLQERLNVDQSQIQIFTSAVFALRDALAMLSNPIIGHFADENLKLASIYEENERGFGLGTIAGPTVSDLLLEIAGY